MTETDGSRRPTPETADPPSPRRRGRPPRLSKDRIVRAVLALLEEQPHEVPTIARIATQIEAVPAALYRHFDSLDEILDAVITRVLSDGPSDLEEDETWSDQLEQWMHDLRSHLLRYPAVLTMIDRSGRTSPAWLEASSAVVSILSRAGLSGHELATTYLWVLETTVGLVMQEAALPLSEQLASARASRSELSARARRRFAPIVDELEAIDADTFFGFAVEQTKATVARLTAAPERR